jgi:hypothetical protein
MTAVSYDDYQDADDGQFWLSCTIALVLGISLLIARTALNFGIWSVVVGVLLVGVSGPFIFAFLGNHVAEPTDRLVHGFGRSLPGIALALVSNIALASTNLKPELRTIFNFAMICALVWIAIFLGGGIVRYLWLRRTGHGLVWFESDDGDEPGWYERPTWSSYEWTSIVVAVISGGGSIAAVVVELVK